mgnify:CR=1 FL=1
MTGSVGAFTNALGHRIHYETRGAGPALVLVHGWGSDARGNWLSTGWVDALCDLRRIVLLDVRGHGLSDKPLDPACYGYADMAQDVLGLLDHLRIERADYLGYSMGAFMGAWLLGHAGGRFRSMILGGVGIETPASIAAVDAVAAALRTADAAAVTDPVGRAVRAFVDADPAIDAVAREALAVSALRMWPEGDAVALGGAGLAAVARPVLLVVGSEDRPYVDTVDRVAAAIPGARTVRLPGCDHLSAVRAPAFRAAVRELLTAP